MTDVVEVGGAARLHSYTGTLRSGLSVGHEHAAIGSGSIGVLLERSGDEHAYFVSCAHVIALARAGRPKAAPGQFIEQPYDEANDPADADAAVLANDFSPLTEREVQTDDFAIARLLPGDSWDPALKGSTVSVTALSTLDGPDDFAKGMEVTHYGAANGPADGIVTHVEGNFRIPAAGESEFDEWIYRGLIAYSTDSDHGDSGGAVVEAGTTTLVGLHTGGFENSSVGFFFPIGPTLAALGYSPISARPKPAV